MQKHRDPGKNGPSAASAPDVPFSSNEVRLSPGEWVIAGIVLVASLYFIPILWQQVEPLGAGVDYRIPYRLGEDYWTYSRYCRDACSQDKALVIGDSVVWGHYVGPNETLSHYLNELADEDRFANLGVDGIHPAALAGLIEHYGRAISGKDVILHCNFLWMSSKRHDLQVAKEFVFNHPQLVPQFFPQIPCYRESLSGRLGIVVGRNVPLFGWTKHLQIAYFENTDVPLWTLEHPYDNPAAAVTFELPAADEPPSPEPVAKPWSEKGIPRFNPSWVELATSFQWRSFQRTIEILRRRGNRVFVLVGPFNEHMLTEASLEVYKERQREAEAWFRSNGVPYAIPPALPTDDYADASHPLGEGYRMLASRLLENRSFADFTGKHQSVAGHSPPIRDHGTTVPE